MSRHRRLTFLLWIAGLLSFIAVALFPLSNRYTRAGGLALFCVVWISLLALCWKRRAARFLHFGVSAAALVFLLLPARPLPSPDLLRADYVAALQRYNGVRYFWGGESPKGIDCSGLIRRGLIDALFLRGLRTGDAGLVRRSIALWWYDTSAEALGQSYAGLTTPILATPSINALDHAQLLPGDLAVTRDGLHIMAYLGARRWIEADPGLAQVVTVAAPSKDNMWFAARMNIVRWSIFQR